jgi:membrane associated rhomboid family serine protease
MNFNEQTRFGSAITPGIKKLIIINVIVFFGQQFFNMASPVYIERIFGLVPAAVLHKFYIWQLLTYMFMHGSFFHILFNMFVLWMFGSDVERRWGTHDFYVYYFVTGIGAGLFNVLFEPGSTIPIVGASGAIYGVLLAFGLLFPNRQIYIYFLFPVRAKYLVMMFAGMSFMYAFSQRSDGVAHFAHLGGMVVGYLYLKLDWKFEGFSEKLHSLFKSKPKMKVHRPEKKGNGGINDQIDEILDKINEVGYEKLTDEEKDLLRRASSYYSNRDD